MMKHDMDEIIMLINYVLQLGENEKETAAGAPIQQVRTDDDFWDF